LERTIRERYDVVTEEVDVANRSFSILRVRDTNRLLDRIDPAVFARDERLPYWAELWSSSMALASACLLEFDLRGMRVLELGCGLGLAGIAAARAGATVTMTDYEEDALLFAEYNRLVNLPDPEGEAACESRLLDWRAPGRTGMYDVVLGADIIYEERNHLPLLTILDRCLLPGGYACLTDPGRRTAPLFKTLALSRGFAVQEHEGCVTHGGKSTSVKRYAVRHDGPKLPAGGCS